jgi:hypothetical protein
MGDVMVLILKIEKEAKKCRHFLEAGKFKA